MPKLAIIDKEAVNRGVNVTQLTPVFEGNFTECERYAIKNNWIWQPDGKSLYGGYWKKPDGDCLVPI